MRTKREKIFDKMLGQFVEKIGQRNIGSFFKAKYLLSWGGNADYTEQRQLLLVLAYSLSKKSQGCCTCLRYCETKKQIQIAFASAKNVDFDNLTWETLHELIKLHNQLHNNQQNKKLLLDIKEKYRKLFEIAIMKDSENINLKSKNRVIKILSGKRDEDKKAVQTFKELWDNISSFTKQSKIANNDS